MFRLGSDIQLNLQLRLRCHNASAMLSELSQPIWVVNWCFAVSHPTQQYAYPSRVQKTCRSIVTHEPQLQV